MKYYSGSRRQEQSLLKKAGMILAGITGTTLFCYGLSFTPIQEKYVKATLPAGTCEQRIRSGKNFEVREIPLSWGNTYNIYTAGEKVGVIREQVFHFGKRFDLYAGNEEKHLGWIDEQVFSFGHKSRIFDEHGSCIGQLDEVVLRLTPGHVIEIKDVIGNVRAVSRERIFSMGHTADIMSPDKKISYGTSRKHVFLDQYIVHMLHPTLDSRVILALVAMEDKLEDEAADATTHVDDK